MIYDNYQIKEGDLFKHDQYPALETEMAILVSAMAEIPACRNKEMLLAFVRDHHIKLEWMNDNPELCEHLCSGSIPTVCLEALFNSCLYNDTFQKQLEAYIEAKFAGSTINN